MGIFFLKEPIRQKNKTLLEMLEAREIPLLPYLQNHPSIQDMEVCLWLLRKKTANVSICYLQFISLQNMAGIQKWPCCIQIETAARVCSLVIWVVIFFYIRQHRIAAQSHISQQHFGVPLNLTLIRRMKYLLVIIIRLKSSVLLKS